jgi:hypothetical protein
VRLLACCWLPQPPCGSCHAPLPPPPPPHTHHSLPATCTAHLHTPCARRAAAACGVVPGHQAHRCAQGVRVVRVCACVCGGGGGGAAPACVSRPPRPACLACPHCCAAAGAGAAFPPPRRG